jgi:hypothetical protein
LSASAEEIVAKLEKRRADEGQALARMIAIRDAYHGDVVVPLPEIERDEMPAVANLLNQGLEQMALRVSSVTPDVVCPPRDPHLKNEIKSAQRRRNAIFGWWEANRVDQKLGQMARHLLGYAHAYVWVGWNTEKGIPTYRVCDPLNTYPDPAFLLDHANTAAADVIAVHTRRLDTMAQRYPVLAQLQASKNMDPDTIIELAEYVDHDSCVLVLVGSRNPHDPPYGASVFGGVQSQGMPTMVLDAYENRAGCVPVGCAVRMGLDRPMSKFEGMLGMYQMQARLMALEVLAVEKGIFADQWVVSRPGETARIITPADGLRGILGEIQGGEIREVQTNPGFMTNPTIDRLERNQRVSAGIPADFGGESASNIRTGRRGDAVLSATIDFPIAESQKQLARLLQHANRAGIGLTKAYAGSAKKSFYVTWKGANKGWNDYTPSEDFTTDENIVSYSSPGADLNDLVVGGGQRLGMKTMSRRRFMALDPLVEDPELEADMVVAEALDDAMLAGLQQQVAGGTIPPADVARIRMLVKTDKLELAEAIEKVQREAQERQATPAPVGSPETQPGLALPGMGAEQPPEPAATQQPGGLAGLRSLLGSLQAPAG